MKIIKSPEEVLYSLSDEDVHFKKGTYAEELALTAIKVYHDQFQNEPDSKWIKYDFNIIESRPKETIKYVVQRKDGKIHMEKWNGSGWAYNGNVITHYLIIKPAKDE